MPLYNCCCCSYNEKMLVWRLSIQFTECQFQGRRKTNSVHVRVLFCQLWVVFSNNNNNNHYKLAKSPLVLKSYVIACFTIIPHTIFVWWVSRFIEKKVTISADILYRRCPFESSFISTYHGKCRCKHKILGYSLIYYYSIKCFFYNKSLNFNNFLCSIAFRYARYPTKGQENAHTKHLRQWNAIDVFLLHWCCSYCDSLVALLGVFFGRPKKFYFAITSLTFDFGWFFSRLILFRCVRWFYLVQNLIIHIFFSMHKWNKKNSHSVTTQSKSTLLNEPRPNSVWFSSKKSDSNHCALRMVFNRFALTANPYSYEKYLKYVFFYFSKSV